MRVISGTARNTKLLAVEGTQTRPTVDRVKEAIFSSIQFLVPGARVLDLFAGTGQMGIEALSRGAILGVFVDNSRDATEIVAKNLKACGLFEKSRVANMQAVDFLRTAKEKFDIVFLDPPYDMGILDEILPLVCAILSDSGIIITESEISYTLKDEIDQLNMIKSYKYGNVLVTKFQKCSKGE